MFRERDDLAAGVIKLEVGRDRSDVGDSDGVAVARNDNQRGEAGDKHHESGDKSKLRTASGSGQRHEIGLTNTTCSRCEWSTGIGAIRGCGPSCTSPSDPCSYGNIPPEVQATTAFSPANTTAYRTLLL